MSSKKLRRNIYIQKIEYYIVKFFLLLAKYLPKNFIYSFFYLLSMLGFHLIIKRREIAIKNIKMIYDIDDKKAYDFVKKVYQELSQTVAEILLMIVNKFNVDSAIENIDEVHDRLAKIAPRSKNGIIFITAHFSNWELLAQFLAKNGFPMVVIGRKGSNKLIDKYITIPFRNRYKNRAVDKNNSMVTMAKALKKGGIIGMLIDQKTSGSHSAKVPFFGHDAPTTMSTASLKLKFDPLLIPVSVVRQSKGKYKMYIDDTIEYKAEEIANEKEKLVAMTTSYNKAIEHIISRDPNQWFWMHNRWKW